LNQFSQLILIFKTLGTPDIKDWPELADINSYSINYPKFKARGLSFLKKDHGIDDVTLDLISRLLVLNPLRRITCK